MSIELLATALALAFIIEGLMPALFPNRWRSYLIKLSAEPVQTIRIIGLIIICVGASILWIIQ